MAIDIYQQVTDTIIAQLEKGIVPWVRPWSSKTATAGDVTMPMNYTTKRPYSGINVLLLWGKAWNAGYANNQWLTYKQALAVGGNVKKGEKGTQIIFYTMFQSKTEFRPNGDPVMIPMIKGYTVFNIEQCEGIEPDSVVVMPEPERNAACDAIVKATGASIKHEGNRAYYTPMMDAITMPIPQSFKTMGDYYATLFHELGHWTGHKSRLDRKFGVTHGNEDYAYEELIAELTAAFTCATVQVEPTNRHADYIGSWLAKLQNDKRYVFRAASAASKAANLILGSAEEMDNEKEAA